MLKTNRVLALATTAAIGAATFFGGQVFAAHHEAGEQSKDIVDIAADAGQFETLVAAVKAAGLVDVLKSEGPYTVFAPSDEAFAKLGEETITDLLKPENVEKLAGILKYHVVPGKWMAEDIVGMERAETALGDSLEIESSEGTVTAGGATVISADIEASNGVIHVIDTVLIPEM